MRSGSRAQGHTEAVQQGRPAPQHQPEPPREHPDQQLLAASGGRQRICYAPGKYRSRLEGTGSEDFGIGTTVESRHTVAAGRAATSKGSGRFQGEAGNYGKFELAG